MGEAHRHRGGKSGVRGIELLTVAELQNGIEGWRVRSVGVHGSVREATTNGAAPRYQPLGPKQGDKHPVGRNEGVGINARLQVEAAEHLDHLAVLDPGSMSLSAISISTA